MLMDARNAIAHGNQAQLDALRNRGVPLNLAGAEHWRRALDGLASSIDRLVAASLAGLFEKPRPW